MQIAKLTLIALLPAMLAVSPANALSVQDDVVSYANASNAARWELVVFVVRATESLAPGVAALNLKTCMDEAASTSEKAGMTISDLAIGCIELLKE